MYDNMKLEAKTRSLSRVSCCELVELKLPRGKRVASNKAVTGSKKTRKEIESRLAMGSEYNKWRGYCCLAF